MLLVKSIVKSLHLYHRGSIIEAGSIFGFNATALNVQKYDMHLRCVCVCVCVCVIVHGV